MSKQIITVSREFGSGGRTIAKESYGMVAVFKTYMVTCGTCFS